MRHRSTRSDPNHEAFRLNHDDILNERAQERVGELTINIMEHYLIPVFLFIGPNKNQTGVGGGAHNDDVTLLIVIKMQNQKTGT